MITIPAITIPAIPPGSKGGLESDVLLGIYLMVDDLNIRESSSHFK